MRRLSPIAVVSLLALIGPAAVARAQAPAATAPAPHPGAAAEALIRDAIAARMGDAVDVVVTRVDGIDGRTYREARPDPSARLGRPVRVTLVPERGQAIVVTADVRVIADQVIATRAILRHATVLPEDVRVVRQPLVDAPIRRLPALRQVAGARALRPIAEGAIVLHGFVALPKAVEAGDRVTVIAAVGAVEVSATFVAADGGAEGDLIRVMNPETRRYVRGRIVRKGVVEVIYER
jgi:flagella basal body P-ring formation protein FlgA